VKRLEKAAFPFLAGLLASLVACLVAGFGFTPGALAQPGFISTVAGGGPNDIPALNANLNLPWEVAVDLQGNYYVAAGGGSSRVFKISPSGLLTVVAGNGFAGYSGDGGPAQAAELHNPHGVAVDNSNPANVYIDDWANCLIRRVDGKTGIITTIAGRVTNPFTPDCKNTGDGGAAKDATIDIGWTIAVDPRNHDLYFTQDGYFGGEGNDGTVRKIAGGVPDGIITTVAGNLNQCGGSAPNGVSATASDAFLCHPQSVAIDTSVSPANIFVDNWGDGTIREVVGSSGKMYTIAHGFGDPWQMAIQVSGKATTVTLPDFGKNDFIQFPITYSGGVPTAGEGTVIAKGIQGTGLAIDAEGNIIIADHGTNHILEIVKKTGKIVTIEGWATNAYSDPVGIINVPATGISLDQPAGPYFDHASGKLYFGGYSTQAVYQMNPGTGLVSNFAGNGIPGFSGNGGSATAPGTELRNPVGVVKDSRGNTYIADLSNCAVREVFASTGDIATIAGGSGNKLNGCGYSGNGGPAEKAQLNAPTSLAIDGANNLYISDYNNCVIRLINAKTHFISDFAGVASCGYNGDGIPATAAQLNAPWGIALTAAGDLFISEERNHRIRKVDSASGLISTVAGNGVRGYTGDGLATANALDQPTGLAADDNGNIFFSDQGNNILRWVDPAGYMTTFAGKPQVNGFGGDGGPATAAMLATPNGLTLDSEGNAYFADLANGRIRKVTAFAGYGRSTSALSFGLQQVGTTSDFQPVMLSAVGPVAIDSVTAPGGFSEIDDCTGVELIAGESCEIDVYFSPTASGVAKGTLTIASNPPLATPAQTVILEGIGAGLSITGSLAFPAQQVGASSTRTVTLVNSGAIVKITSISIPGTTDFTVSGGTCPAKGGTLAAKASCTITVKFSGTAAGTLHRALAVYSSDPGSPLLFEVSGTLTK